MHPTYAAILRPNKRQETLLYNLALVLAGSLLIALSARISIHLPLSPVPITGQTFAVLLLAALYGRTLGAATLLTYIAEGLAGLPIFADGVGGVQVLLGPTAGYLIGFVAAAFLVGYLAEQG